MKGPLVQVQAGCWGHTIGGRAHFLTRAVDFVVHPGEIVMLTGANGSGKTTILRGLLGLVAQRAGRVDLRVAPLHVGYVPQESVIDRSIPATVLDIVRTGDPARWARGRSAAIQALGAVDMADRQALLFARLSGGQRQRVLIARALVGRPRLLLLDEPTINVDAPTALRIGSLLARLADEDLGILVTSHVTDWIAATRTVAIAPAEDAP